MALGWRSRRDEISPSPLHAGVNEMNRLRCFPTPKKGALDTSVCLTITWFRNRNYFASHAFTLCAVKTSTEHIKKNKSLSFFKFQEINIWIRDNIWSAMRVCREAVLNSRFLLFSPENWTFMMSLYPTKQYFYESLRFSASKAKIKKNISCVSERLVLFLRTGRSSASRNCIYYGNNDLFIHHSCYEHKLYITGEVLFIEKLLHLYAVR